MSREGVEARGRLAFLGVAALASILFTAGSASAPLIDPDEARFARTSVEMLRSGDLVVPTFGGQPRLTKPPLGHWLQAASFRWFGETAAAARLPAQLASLGTLLLLGAVARRRFGEEGSAWSAAFYATMPLVVATAKVGTLDALLALHVFGAVALDVADAGQPRRLRASAVGALLGLAFLVKGPVGVLLPLLAMLAGRTASGRPVVPPARAWLEAAAAWCVVALPWGLAFLERVGPSTAWQVVRAEVLERYFAGSVHVEAPWYYAPVTLVAFLPWSVPLAMGAARALVRRGSGAPTALYSAAAVLAALLFLSVGQGKLPSYILPIAPLAALLVTWELGQEILERRQRMLGPGLFTGGLAVAALVAVLASGHPRADEHRWLALAIAAAYGIGALAALPALLGRRPRLVYLAGVLAAGAVAAVCALGLFPRVAAARSAAGLVGAWAELGTERPLLAVEHRAPSLVFYLDRPVEELDLDELPARLTRGDRPLIVMIRQDLPAIPMHLRPALRIVRSRGKFVLLEPRLPDS